MKRVAVSRLIASDNKELSNQVVEMEGGKVIAHYPLTHELPHTEWIGGTLHIDEEDRAVHTINNKTHIIA